MNILFFETGLDPQTGGVQRVTYNIAKRLKADGYSSFVAYKTDEIFTDAYHEAFDGGIQVSSFHKVSVEAVSEFMDAHHVSVIINQCGGGWKDTRFLDMARCGKAVKLYSFVHISPTGSQDVLRFRDMRFPKLVLRSVLKEIMYCFCRIDKLQYKRIYRLSDKLVVLSKSYIPTMKALLGNKDEAGKVMAITNSIAALPSQRNILEEKRKMMLVVARMGETPKKLSRILDAWHQVNSKLSDWELVFVGDGADLAAYKRIASSLNLPRLTFTGFANPTPYYKAASIFLMTSATEGFGMTLIESQRCGAVPIVMDSFGAVHDIIRDGYNGFITPNGDIDAFSDKMLQLATDENLRREMAQNAMQSVSRFSEEEIIVQWKRLLSDE